MKLAFLLVAALSPLISFAQMDSISHSLGIVLAKSVQSQGLPVTDLDAFNAGFKEVMTTDVSDAEVQKAQMMIQAHMEKKQAEKGMAAKSEGEAFLKANAAKPGVITTASGLQYEILQKGTGEHPKASDKVTVHYTGKNLDGSVFDSSVERGQPATFPLNGVIPGWTEGVQLMTPGSKFRFYIPSDLAYGDRGAGADIAPGATLMFDVELISID
jgi:FKBP-type peptidyl-prolyl cis-trans isomerase FklB